MTIFKVKVDAWRGSTEKNAKRMRIEFLVEADDIDAAEPLALNAASSYTAGYKIRCVEWVSSSGPETGPFCIRKKEMKV